jgi:hypothetical protein
MVVEKQQRTVRMALGVICLLILCILLTAGLWPFSAPRNGVKWNGERSGVRFRSNGIIASAERFRASSPDGTCTLELLLQPAQIKGSGTILAFDSSPYPKSPFIVEQRWEDVAIQRAGIGSFSSRRSAIFSTVGQAGGVGPIGPMSA